MEEQLISFETAKLAKEKGFDWKCYWYCTYKRKAPTNEQSFFPELGIYDNFNNDNNGFYEFFSLPTQSLLQRWLREVYNFNVYIQPLEFNSIEGYGYCYPFDLGGHGLLTKQENGRNYKTYEAALEKGLKEALKLIK
jgi:hypothetical protein